MGEAQRNGGQTEVGIGEQVSRKAWREYEDMWVGRHGGIRGEGER